MVVLILGVSTLNVTKFSKRKMKKKPSKWCLLGDNRENRPILVGECRHNEKKSELYGKWRLHNCGSTTEATTRLQQFIKKKKKKRKKDSHYITALLKLS